MTSSFNPYREWLGLPIDGRTPNHYELLDVRRDEDDDLQIKEAADRVIARVRRCRPGSYVKQWTTLLDQIGAAGTCLLDTVQRRAYDETLETQVTTNDNSKSKIVTGRSSRPSVDQVNPAYPPGMGGNAPLSGQQSSGGLEAHATENVDDAFFFDTEDSDEDWHPYDPDESVAAATEDDGPVFEPMDSESLDRALPGESQHSEAKPPDGAVPLTNDAAPSSFGGPVDSRPKSVHKRRNFPVTGIGLCVCIGCLTIAVGLAANQLIKQTPAWNSVDEESMQRDETDGDNDETGAVARPASGATIEDNLVASPPIPPRENAKVQANGRPRTRVEISGHAEEEAAVDIPPMHDEAPTPIPAEPRETQDLSEEDKRRFTAAIDDVRLQLGARDFAEAESELARWEQLAQSAEQRQTVRRFQMLRIYVGKFWDAVGYGMKDLDRVGELQVKSTYVSIVESDERKITIRVAGKNRTYRKHALPSGLAMAIAKNWFDRNNSANKIAEGAFLAVEPNANDELARTASEDASRAGEDVKDLLIILERPRPDPK